MDRAEILRRAERLNVASDRVHTTADRRDSGASAMADWRQAADDFHVAFESMYADTNIIIGRLQAGSVEGVEPAITFLEADPWCFRSGYVKADILRSLVRCPLTTDQAARLRQVVLYVVDRRDRREFRRYCRLAQIVDSEDLRRGLVARLRSGDRGVVRRALSVLESLDSDKLADGDLAIAQGIVMELVPTDVYWRDHAGLSRSARRYWTTAWERQLLDDATGQTGARQNAAVRALALVPRIDATPSQRAVLRDRLLDVIDTDGDPFWFENLAALLDDPTLVEGLQARVADPGRSDEVRRRSKWALNAIARSRPRSRRTPRAQG